MLQSSLRKFNLRILRRWLSSFTKKEEGEFVLKIKNLTGFSPLNSSIYELAFRHRSANSTKKHQLNNERLEFLGDAVLSTIVAELLYIRYPDKNEGFLTAMRSKIVSRNNLNLIANQLNLKGLIASRIDGHKTAKSIGGNTLEALIGALYLDLGIDAARSFVSSTVMTESSKLMQLESHVLSYKGLMIEWAQKARKTVSFDLLDSWGQQHNKTFKIGLSLNGELISTGHGQSKKQAQEVAAKAAYEQLGLLA
jgi:ribonuclease-3